MLALGIDTADDAVTLALLETGARSARLVGSWREARVPGEPLADALRKAIAAHCPSPPETVATALPGKHATFRILRLPFSDQSRLAATVPYELESLVPFDLATAITAFVALDRSPTGTTIFAAIAPRDAVAAHVEQMRAAGIDPAIVDLGALAVAALFERHADVLVAELRDGGGVALLRGGRLAGLHVLDAGDGGDRAALLGQARWAALALADGQPTPPIALVGPAADAGRALAGEVGAPVAAPSQHLPPWAAGAPVAHLRAVALAARAAGAVKTGVNLRAGDLAYHAPSEEARRQLRATAMIAGAAVLLGIASVAVAVAERRAELGALRAQIAETARAVLPSAAAGNERVQLESAVEALARRRDSLVGAAAGRPSALDLMRSISEAVPAQTPFEVQDLSIDADGLRLHARTDSYESVDVVKRALQTVPGTRDAQVKDVKTGIDGRVEFRAALAFAREGQP
ncbi:MAG TPA: pilus assembly protein PilM [Candidatus Binatia bacterium]|nr:pilus assembly protein PilM [Candidatus Binatia bacterium]